MINFPVDDHALARLVASEVAVVLLEVRADGAGLVPDVVRANGDRLAHDRAVELLLAARPDDLVLSEEGIDDPRRLGSDRVWVIDPLDGTREFGERGRTDWAVHIALVEDGLPTAGAVALPALGQVFATDHPPVVPPIDGRGHRVAANRTWVTPVVRTVAQALDADLVPIGSAGGKAMAVVRGDVDAYAHAGGMYEWDSAAPVAVAAAAGLHVSRIDGSPMRYNQVSTWLPDLLICRPELAEICLDAIAEIGWW
jgi:3'(2'), 5'-bisphosphate nucleotidase